MRVAIFINTPAQVHLYKNVVRELERKGHEAVVVARRYRETIPLLNELGIGYVECSNPPISRAGKVITFPADIACAYALLRTRPPDLILDAGIFGAWTSKLLRRPCVVFTDSEPTPLQSALTLPLVERMITPESFRKDFGKKHLRVNSYKELAYLHPNHFRPNPDVLKLLGLEPSERFVLLRFNSFDAVHDFGRRGFSLSEKRRLVEALEPFARILISSETQLPPDLKRHELVLPKHMIHHVLYYSALVIADTQTIATEAAVLGTPVVRHNTFVGENDMGNFLELERKYGLVFNCSDPEDAIRKAVSIAREGNGKGPWLEKRKRLLEDKIDLCDYLVGFIEDWKKV